MTVLNDILDFSKIEAGKVELRPGPCRPRALLEEVAELFAARAELKHLEILCHVHPDVPSSGRGRWRSPAPGGDEPGRQRGQVHRRRRGRRAGHVVSGVAGADCTLEFTVIDTGIGIDASAAGARCSRHSRRRMARSTRRFGGTGLGLAISKKLVKLMGGRAGCEQ